MLGSINRRGRRLRAAVRQLQADHHPLPRRAWATRSSSQLPLQTLQQIGFGEDETLFERDDRFFSGFELLRDFFVVPEQVPRLQAARACASCCRRSMRRPSTYFSSAARRRPRLAVDRQPGHVLALHRSRRQSVRDELQPRAGAARRARAPRRPGPQPRARIRGAPHHRRFCALSLAEGKGPRLSALQPARPTMCARSDALYYTMRRLPRRRTLAGAARRRAEQLCG